MESVPHIYLSALPFLPQSSLLRQRLEHVFNHWDIVSNSKPEWDAVLWERSAGTELYSVAFSPNGRYVTCGGDDGAVRTWDASSGAAQGSPLRWHFSSVICVVYSPDGRLVASGSWDHTVQIWNSETGEALCGPSRGTVTECRALHSLQTVFCLLPPRWMVHFAFGTPTVECREGDHWQAVEAA